MLSPSRLRLRTFLRLHTNITKPNICIRHRTTFTMVKTDSAAVEKFRFGFLPSGLKPVAYFANATIMSTAVLIHPICIAVPFFITYLCHRSYKNLLCSLVYQLPLWCILYPFPIVLAFETFRSPLLELKSSGIEPLTFLIGAANMIGLIYLPCAVPVRYMYHTIRVTPGRIASKIMAPFRRNTRIKKNIERIMEKPMRRAKVANRHSEIRKGIERRLGNQLAEHCVQLLGIAMTVAGAWMLAKIKQKYFNTESDNDQFISVITNTINTEQGIDNGIAELMLNDENQDLRDWFSEYVAFREKQNNEKYCELFLQHGYNDLDIIKCMNEKDLIDIGVDIHGHRKQILIGIKKYTLL
eukprot:520480_1